MLYREMCRIIGFYLLLFSVALLLPLGVALYYQYFSATYHPQPHTTVDFGLTLLLTLGLALILLFFGRKVTGHLYRREGIASVVLIWLITPAIASIPFLTSGTLKDPFQAYFEMVSGFTTTGSTVLQGKKFDAEGQELPIVHTIPGVIDTEYQFYGTVDPLRHPTSGKIIKEGIEAVGKGLLFWRCFTQWLGGMGIVVLFVAVLPALGMGGKLLFQSEVAGPVKESSTPRIKETAMQLWYIYMGLTVLQTGILMLTNTALPFFDAINITFATLATGGFSNLNTNIGGYQNVATEWVVIIFMVAGSINFALYYYLVKGKFYKVIEPEFLLYMVILFVFGGLTVYGIYGLKEIQVGQLPVYLMVGEEAFRKGLFQLVSALTSTGFFSTDYDMWPYATQVLLLVAMFVGGMSGSTAGGIKTIRHYMLFRTTQNKVESLFRPEHVRIFKMGEREVDQNTSISVLCFFWIVISFATLGTFAFIYDGIDPETSLGLVACMMNNTGFSFRMAGPQFSCAFLSDFSLAVSSLLMLLGRLEYFVLLAVLVPAFWRQDK